MSDDNWIMFERQKYQLKPGERALDALLRQGAPVHFSCRKGACRSCMLQLVSGDVDPNATEKLPSDFQQMGFFLPCLAANNAKVIAKRPDLSNCTHEAIIAEKTYAAPDIVILKLEPATQLDWRAGQVIGLIGETGAMRSYSIVSSSFDYLLELHIRILPGGELSGWVDGLSVGDMVRFQGPAGNFVYDEGMGARPLLLIGTGTGCGVLTGIVQDALAKGHRGPIHLYLGGRRANDLYLKEHVGDFPKQVHITQAASRESIDGIPAARIVDLAMQAHPDLTEAEVFICGNPNMCESARIMAVRNGVALNHLHSDAFEPPTPYQTNEREKLAVLPPDLELWDALGQGAVLTDILTEFYTALFDDPLLSPFFQRTTKQRAIEKQYNFLQDVFSGTKLYFGEKPFNAHHWMVISDELFDYRENMLFDIVRRYGIPDRMIHRWAAIHEMFRRDIVKSTARGLVQHGVEVNLEGYCHETLGVGSVCDGCQEEITAGDTVLMHNRTGEIYCAACEGKHITPVA